MEVQKANTLKKLAVEGAEGLPPGAVPGVSGPR
jgi:hypothetical protein